MTAKKEAICIVDGWYIGNDQINIKPRADKNHLKSRDELTKGGTQLFHEINNFLLFKIILVFLQRR